MILHVLEQLLFMPSPLQRMTPDFASSHSATDRYLDASVGLGRCELGSDGPEQSAGGATADEHVQQVRLPTPIMVRGIGQKDLDRHWAAFCKMLRELGVPMCCPISQLRPVGNERSPFRIGRRVANQAFDRFELDSSDAFELDCRYVDGSVWGWPSEVGNTHEIGPLVCATRNVLRSGTPVGVVLPAGACVQDVHRCLEANVDFITFVASPDDECGFLLVKSLAQTREICAGNGRTQLPIIVDAPVSRISHISLYLALGASVVSIDNLLLPLISKLAKPEPKPAGGGMLSGIAVVPAETTHSLLELEGLIREMMIDVRKHMQKCGATQLTAMNPSCLRGVTEHAARIAGVPSL